jgi:hypothetical protein
MKLSPIHLAGPHSPRPVAARYRRQVSVDEALPVLQSQWQSSSSPRAPGLCSPSANPAWRRNGVTLAVRPDP